MKTRTLTEDQIQNAITRYNLGHSLKVISTDLGVSRGTLTKRLRKAGVEIRRRGRIKKAYNQVDVKPNDKLQFGMAIIKKKFHKTMTHKKEYTPPKQSHKAKSKKDHQKGQYVIKN